MLLVPVAVSQVALTPNMLVASIRTDILLYCNLSERQEARIGQGFKHCCNVRECHHAW